MSDFEQEKKEYLAERAASIEGLSSPLGSRITSANNPYFHVFRDLREDVEDNALPVSVQLRNLASQLNEDLECVCQNLLEHGELHELSIVSRMAFQVREALEENLKEIENSSTDRPV